MADQEQQHKPTTQETKSKEEEAPQTPNGSFKLNAYAPEFVPRSTPVPVSAYFYPCYGYVIGSNNDGEGSDWFYEGVDQDTTESMLAQANCSKNVLSDELCAKIVKQVEYQLSDMNLLANEYISKCMNKDPEGYVPIPVIASTKKIKSLVTSHQLLSQALRASSKLVVSSDGKKVKRKHPFTDKDREDLLSRTIIAENLPGDHSRQNIEKIFSVVGRIKSIRLCHPPESNSSRPKGDFLISNMLHALIEYETSAIAEKAVEKLNDERNWRKGLRVRLLLRASPRSVLKGRRQDFDGIMGDDETGHDSSDDLYSSDLGSENNSKENSPRAKRVYGRGCGKGRAQATITESLAKQSPKGPRMPDGTKGFAMGRGKPVPSPV